MEKNKISLFAAILMNINLMVGAGIFLGPLMMAQKAGDSSAFGWILAIALLFPIVYTIAQVTTLFPGEGSFYAYSKHSLGRAGGFISGWMYFLGYVGLNGLQTIALKGVLINQLGLAFLNDYPIAFYIVFIGLLFLLNLFNLNLVAQIQNSATLLKLLPVLFVLAIFGFYWNSSLAMFEPKNLFNLPQAVPIAIFGFWGFEGCASISHLIRGDHKNAYRAIMIAFFITATIYFFFHLGILHIMGTSTLLQEGVPGFVNHLHFSSPLFSQLLNGLIIMSIVIAYMSAIYGVFISNSSLLNAMAHENLFFFSSFIARTNKYQRPWTALLIHSSILLLIVSLVENLDALNAIGNLGMLTAFFLTFISLFILQRKKHHVLGLATTVVALACTTILAYLSWNVAGTTHMERFVNIIPFFVVILAGFGMYFVKSRNR